MIIVCAIISCHASAQDWRLDSSFGTGGKVVSHFSNPLIGDLSIRATAIQSDGKIIAAGIDYNGKIVIVRYNSDGSVDNSFGSGGIIDNMMPAGSSRTKEMILLPDGRILLAADVYHPGFGYNLLGLTKYNNNGTLDYSFGVNGRVLTDIALGAGQSIYSMVVQPDGKILVGNDSAYSTAIVRYKQDGSLDSSFGGDGIATILPDSNTSAWSIFASLALQPDGKIIGAGYYIDSSILATPAVARFLPDGSLDPTFGSSGVTISYGTNNQRQLNYTIVQPNGDILVGGREYSGGVEFIILGRYKANGVLDSSFGTAGWLLSPFTNGDNHFSRMALQADGKIIMAGYVSDVNANVDFIVARYLANGSLDTSFGTTGFITTNFGTKYDLCFALSLQPDGKIVLAGESGTYTLNFALARYALSGSSGTGIAQHINEVSGFFVYPNPTKDKIMIEYEQQQDANVTIELVDMYGKVACVFVKDQYTYKGSHKAEFKLPDVLALGVYLLRIQCGSDNASIRIINQ